MSLMSLISGTQEITQDSEEVRRNPAGLKRYGLKFHVFFWKQLLKYIFTEPSNYVTREIFLIYFKRQKHLKQKE